MTTIQTEALGTAVVVTGTYEVARKASAEYGVVGYEGASILTTHTITIEALGRFTGHPVGEGYDIAAYAFDKLMLEVIEACDIDDAFAAAKGMREILASVELDGEAQESGAQTVQRFTIALPAKAVQA